MKKKPYVIFFGLGGGVRALISLGVLAKLRELRDSHFIHGVDCLAGPSTAAIYLSGFNRPNPNNPDEPFWSESDMVHNYQIATPEIFNLHPHRRHLRGIANDLLPQSISNVKAVQRVLDQSHKYDPDILEDFLDKCVGTTRLKDGLRSQVIPTKTYQGKNLRLQNIKEAPDENFEENTLLRQAAMASAMHPLCYPSYRLELQTGTYDCIDGGLFESPLHVYLKLKKALPADREIHMIYMSTGLEPAPQCDKGTFDKLGLSGHFSFRHQMPLAYESTSGQYQESMNILREQLEDRLIEFDFKLADYLKPQDIPILDDARPEALAKYADIAQRLVIDKADQFRGIYDMLNMRQMWDLDAELAAAMAQETKTAHRQGKEPSWWKFPTMPSFPPSIPKPSWLSKSGENFSKPSTPQPKNTMH